MTRIAEPVFPNAFGRRIECSVTGAGTRVTIDPSIDEERDGVGGVGGALSTEAMMSGCAVGVGRRKNPVEWGSSYIQYSPIRTLSKSRLVSDVRRRDY